MVSDNTAVSEYLAGNPAIIRGNGASDSTAKARETAQQFEALLVQTMLKAMRKTTPGNSLFGSSQADMYMDFFDREISGGIASNGSLGIAEAILRQLSPDDKASATGTGDSVNSTGSVLPPSVSAYASDPMAGRIDDDKSSFVQRIYAEARQVGRRLGTTAEAVIAIAALESSWGQRVAKNGDGSSTHNLFGIKADTAWQGNRSDNMTLEFDQGRFVERKAAFRSYPSESQSVRDFGEFITVNPRYRPALVNAADPERFIREIHKAGYATDPDYADKAIRILHGLAI